MNINPVAFRCVCVWIRSLLLAWPLVAILKAADSVDPAFTRVLSDPVVLSGASTGCAWGDYNNDGWIDLAVSKFSGNYIIYTNNGNGAFTRITTGDVAATSGASFGACWSDYD